MSLKLTGILLFLLVFLAADQEGNIYVADTYNDRIQKLDPQGRFQASWGKTGVKEGEFNRPYGVAVDAAGNVYVAEYKGSRAQVFDPAGRYLGKWGISKGRVFLNAPNGIRVGPDGSIYVADYGGDRIQVFRVLFP